MEYNLECFAWVKENVDKVNWVLISENQKLSEY